MQPLSIIGEHIFEAVIVAAASLLFIILIFLPTWSKVMWTHEPANYMALLILTSVCMFLNAISLILFLADSAWCIISIIPAVAVGSVIDNMINQFKMRMRKFYPRVKPLEHGEDDVDAHSDHQLEHNASN